MANDPPLTDHEDIQTYRHLLFKHIASITATGIELADLSVVAAHEPQLLARWMQHAYRIAALADLETAYAQAIGVIRDELTGGIRDWQWGTPRIDSTAAWLSKLVSCQEQTHAAYLREIAVFRQVSEQISSKGGFDLAGTIPAGSSGSLAQERQL